MFAAILKFDPYHEPAGSSKGGQFAEKELSIPAEPGTTPIKEGYVRLYHQTDGDNLRSIEKEGLLLSHARGIEGPRAIYAGETPFYGSAESRPTLEFQVPKDQWDAPFVLRDVTPEDIIAAHYPWQRHARYIEKNNLVKNALDGKYDMLKGDEGKAVDYIKKKYGKILKFNHNHGVDGKFSSSNSAASVQSTVPMGIQFVSPNVREGTDIKYAMRRSGGTIQNRFRKDFQAVDNLLGTQGAQEDAIGAWSDGGENSIAQFSANDLPLEKLNVSAAMKGYLAEQKAVVSFKAGKGNQKMHTFDANVSDPVLLSKELVEQGLPFHTLLPHTGQEGFQVIVFSDNASSKEGKALSKNVTKAAKSFGSIHTYMKGSGGFIGSWDTREEGRDEYNKVIDPYITKHPELKAGWDAMVKKMKHRVTKFITLLNRSNPWLK